MFGKRYLAIAVTIFAIGIVFGVKVVNVNTFSCCAIFVAIAMLSVGIFAYCARLDKSYIIKRILAASFAVAAFSFGVIRISLYSASVADLEEYNNKEDFGTFEISDIKENYLEVKVLSSEYSALEGETVRFYYEDTIDSLMIGDTVEVNLKYKFQNNESYLSNGISLSASGEIVAYYEGNGVFAKLRRFIATASDEMFDDFEYSGAIAKAVTIGDKSNLDSYVYSVYSASGISHVLAISGLHVTLIAMCVHKFLVFLTVSRRSASCVAILIVLLYTTFLGFSPSVTRASIMIIAVLISKMFMKRADSITALFVALMLLLLINPYAMFSVGLQLSFLSSFAILVSEPIFNSIYEYFRIKSDLSDSKLVKGLYSFVIALVTPALMSLATTLFSFFVLITTFDTVSYVSPITNIFVVPLFSFALMFSIIAYAIAGISLPLAEFVAKPAGYIFDFITHFSEYIDESGVGEISTHIDWIFIPCIISIIIIISLLFLHKNRLKVFGIASFAFCLSIVLCGIVNAYSNSGFTHIEYGCDDREYVYFKNDEVSIYFDGGGFSSNPSVVFENGLTYIDKYVVTEYNGYAYKNINYFTGKVSISDIYLPKPKNNYEINIFNKIKLLANKRNCVIIEFEEDLLFDFDKVDIEFLHDENISGGMLYSFSCEEKMINIYDDKFEPMGICDVAIFDMFSKDYLIDAASDTLYFNRRSVEDGDFVGYVNTFENTIKIIIDDGESEMKIHES